MSGPESGTGEEFAGDAPQRRAPGQRAPLPRVTEPARTPAERHLGDRLAALLDGELKHDPRERVLAHLATCDACRQEADEQRRTKELLVAAASATPEPSAGLLARLQALPATDRTDDDQGPFAGEPFQGFDLVDRARRSSPLDPPALPGLERAGTGFRIHEIARTARAASSRPAVGHRRRLAFAAAGAFSMAAVALGGALSAEEVPVAARADEPGSSVTPMASRPGGVLPVGSHTTAYSASSAMLDVDEAVALLSGRPSAVLLPNYQPLSVRSLTAPLPSTHPTGAPPSSTAPTPAQSMSVGASVSAPPSALTDSHTLP